MLAGSHDALNNPGNNINKRKFNLKFDTTLCTCYGFPGADGRGGEGKRVKEELGFLASLCPI